jgi:hypothetical protein
MKKIKIPHFLISHTCESQKLGSSRKFFFEFSIIQLEGESDEEVLGISQQW